MTALHIGLRQGSDAWLDYRKTVITATDIGVLLGINAWKCEADLADEKRGLAEPPPATLRMRAGSALQGLIGEEYERVTGRRLRAVRGMVRHPDIEWAAASPDFRVVGEKVLVEAKRSSSRTRFADGIPQDIQAQAVWQAGCAGYPVVDVAVMLGDDDLLIEPIEFNPALFDDLVAVAADFRRRLAEGGPFARDTARIKRDYPADNGAEMVADSDMDVAAKALAETRARRKAMEASETALEDAIKGRMGEIATVRGNGWHATWKRTRDTETTDWRSLADGLLRQLPETERTALVGVHSSARQGFRPFRLVIEKEDTE